MNLQLPKSKTEKRDSKLKRLEAEKYQDIALSHPIEAIAVVEQERRKRQTETTKKIDQNSQEFKTRVSNMVKKEW